MKIHRDLRIFVHKNYILHIRNFVCCTYYIQHTTFILWVEIRLARKARFARFPRQSDLIMQYAAIQFFYSVIKNSPLNLDAVNRWRIISRLPNWVDLNRIVSYSFRPTLQ